MNQAFRIIFMGTPEFALPALEALARSRHTVVAVITQPDRAKGRGRKLTAPPIKVAAERLGLAVIQPITIKTASFAERMQSLTPDLCVVVAFGQILPPSVLCLPRIGAVNIHASLLPLYRGPAPIQWAIINGEKTTGVTTMFMDTGLDTGNILMSAATEIAPEDTAATLHERLAHMGADLLLQTLETFASGAVHPIPQDHERATYAPLLAKTDGRIHWALSAERIANFVRGMTPWPGAFTFHGQTRLRVLTAGPLSVETDATPGTVVQSFPDELRVATGKGLLRVTRIQSSSGKQLPVIEFLRGYRLPPGSVLT